MGGRRPRRNRGGAVWAWEKLVSGQWLVVSRNGQRTTDNGQRTAHQASGGVGQIGAGQQPLLVQHGAAAFTCSRAVFSSQGITLFGLRLRRPKGT